MNLSSNPHTASETDRCHFKDREYSTRVVYSDSDQTVTQRTRKHIRQGQERHAAAEERESRQQQAKTASRIGIFSLLSRLTEDLFPPNQRVRVTGILKRLHKTVLVSFILSTPSLNQE